jgi:PPM family protein phosphatase
MLEAMSCYRAEPDPFPSPAPATTSVFAAARTDTGQERAENQDRALVGDAATEQAWEPPVALGVLAGPAGSFYAAVCDGMGGEAGGALASALAVETIAGAMRARWLQRDSEPAGSIARSEAQVAQAMAASLEAAALRIKHAARAEPVYARMGTTATLAAIAHGALLCAQIGDSRAYLLRGGRLHRLTEDQTMMEHLRRSGALSEEQIRALVGPNVILQALGSSSRLEVALTRTALAQDDVVLLCSDGLHGVVDDAAIAEVLLAAPDLEHACDQLVARANAAGGPDNISCVVLRVVDPALPPSTLPVTTLHATLT